MLQLAVRETQKLPPVIDQPLRVAEIAALLRVSTQTVRAMIKSGRLPGYTLSGRKGSEWRVNESVVREFLASSERVA
jgi:excisionase family DNA binding protein